MTNFLPSADTHIEKRFSVGTIDLKMHNKLSLQEELGWPREPKRALLCFPAGMSEKLGGNLLMDILPGLLAMPVEILVLGKGSPTFGSLFTKLSKEHSHRVAIISEKEESIHKMYAAADMALFLSDPGGWQELEHCLKYGVVPVAPESPMLEDYNPVQETGNAFVAESLNKWHVFASLVRAIETYKFPFDWRTIQRHCMESVEK